jgi:hypothetical protein
MPKNRQRRRDVRTARANARLRYAPEQRALSALVGEAKGELKTDLKLARGLATSAISSAREARRPLKRAYRQAARSADQAQLDVEAALGRTGTGTDAFKALNARHFGLAQEARARELAAERSDLIQQENQARLGKFFAANAARQNYRSTIDKLAQRAGELRGERAQFVVDQLGQLQGARAETREKRRAATLQHQRSQSNIRLQGRVSQRAAEKAAARKAEEKRLEAQGKGPFEAATREDRQQFQSAFAQADSWVKKLRAAKKDNWSQKEIRDALVQGTPSAEGSQGVPKIDNQLAIRAAMEMNYGTNVSRGTVRRLRSFGLLPRDVPGITTPKQFKRRQVRLARQSEKALMAPRY